MSALVLRWRVPEPLIGPRWRGPEGGLYAVSRKSAKPLAAFLVPAATYTAEGAGLTLAGGAFSLDFSAIGDELGLPELAAALDAIPEYTASGDGLKLELGQFSLDYGEIAEGLGLPAFADALNAIPNYTASGNGIELTAAQFSLNYGEIDTGLGLSANFAPKASPVFSGIVTAPQIVAPTLTLGDAGVANRIYLDGTKVSIAGNTLTGVEAHSALSISQTWNTTGAPTAFLLNVTDTASAAGSLLFDVRIGGISRLSLDKFGGLKGAYFSFFGPTGALNIANGATYSIANDTMLARDAADTLALRRGVNPQTFNIYNTITDASNYERGFFGWVGNVFRIGAGAAGTGTNRNVEIHHGGSRALMFNIDGITASRPLAVSGASARLELAEVLAPAAPAANNVRIYAEDDGTGKTRLMARFATGAAQQITIEP